MKIKIFSYCAVLCLAALVLTAQINNPSSSGAATWGLITGTLSSQSDLNTALGLKAPLISPSFTTPTLGAATATTINSFTPGGILSAQVGNTDTVNCPNNTTANFATTYTIPANYLVANKLLRITLAFNAISTATVPSSAFQLNIGGVIVYRASPAAASVTGAAGVPLSISFLIQGSAAAGASAAVYTHGIHPGGESSSSAFTPFSGGNATFNIAQPVNLATNGTLVVQPIYFCSANTAGNSMTLQQLIVEALN